MRQSYLRAPWDYSKVALSLAPVAANGAQTGTAFDRSGYTSIIADYAYAITGGPTGGNVTLQLQDSADNVTFANLGVAVAVAVSAAGVLTLAADISGARRYVRVVSNAGPTGGAAPVATVAGTVRLHGADKLPAA